MDETPASEPKREGVEDSEVAYETEAEAAAGALFTQDLITRMKEASVPKFNGIKKFQHEKRFKALNEYFKKLRKCATEMAKAKNKYVDQCACLERNLKSQVSGLILTPQKKQSCSPSNATPRT